MAFRINYDRLLQFRAAEAIEAGSAIVVSDWIQSNSTGDGADYRLLNSAGVLKGSGDAFVGVAVYAAKKGEVRGYATCPGEMVRVRVSANISADYTPLKANSDGTFEPATGSDKIVAVTLPGRVTGASATSVKILNAILVRGRSWNSVGSPTGATSATPVAAPSGVVPATAVPVATGGIDDLSYAAEGDEWEDNSLTFNSTTNMLEGTTGLTAGEYTLKIRATDEAGQPVVYDAFVVTAT